MFSVRIYTKKFFKSSKTAFKRLKSKQANLEGGWYEFEKDYFDSVSFEGKIIPCISLKGQKIFHTGYELREKDKHDILILENL